MTPTKKNEINSQENISYFEPFYNYGYILDKGNKSNQLVVKLFGEFYKNLVENKMGKEEDFTNIE